MNKCNKCYHNKVCLDSANYKKAEKCSQFKDKSLIVELPCKAGDVVYEIWKNDVVELYITSIELFGDCCDIKYHCEEWDDCDWFRKNDIGKTIFLTREEAEQALKECESNA